MSYNKTNWKTGDVISAEKLNNIEDGIAGAGGVLVVNETIDESTGIATLDKTWQEIYDAMFVGGVIISNRDSLSQRLTQVSGCGADNNFKKCFVSSSDGEQFECFTPDEYPKTSGII